MKELTIKDNTCDVLVIGAGVSGVAAAVAAARCNVKTILIERENFPGGIGYAGLLQHICGLYLNGEAFPEETLNAGLVREIVARLQHLSPERGIKKIGQVYVLPYNREDLKTVFDALCNETPHLRVLYNTSCVSVKNSSGKVTGVKINSSGEIRNISPGVLIDCSGSGAVSEMAGAEFAVSAPDEIQMAGYVMRLKGLRGVDESLSIKVPYYLNEAVSKNILPEHLKYTMFSAGDSADEGYCKLSLNSAAQKTGDDPSAVLRYLAERVPAFKDAFIAETSCGVMEREGRRVCGEYTLTEEDVLGAKRFKDGVVKNSWPIELWEKDKGTVYKYLKPGEYYDIPFRCLKAKGISNLLCAGRCISVTREALGSTRVMGTCMSLGEQAGLAAACYVKNGRYHEKLLYL